MLTMHIKENMATMQHQKQLGLQQDEFSKVQFQHATFIEPLQEIVLQNNMTLTDTYVEVQKILEEAKEKIAEHITARAMADVLEHTARAMADVLKHTAQEKLFTNAAKENVAQLTASTQIES